LFIDVPELDFDPSDCVDIRPFRLTAKTIRPACSVSKTKVLAQQAEYRGIAERLARTHPRTRAYDPLPVFCDEQWCDAAGDGELFYRDRHHLTLSGSRRVAAAFVKWLDVK